MATVSATHAHIQQSIVLLRFAGQRERERQLTIHYAYLPDLPPLPPATSCGMRIAAKRLIKVAVARRSVGTFCFALPGCRAAA